MFQVQSNELEQLWQETDCVKDLCIPVQAPMQQVDDMNKSISLKHVILILPKCAEYADYLDRPFDCYTKLFDFLLRADQNPFANVNQTWYELELTEEHQVTLIFELN